MLVYTNIYEIYIRFVELKVQLNTDIVYCSNITAYYFVVSCVDIVFNTIGISVRNKKINFLFVKPRLLRSNERQSLLENRNISHAYGQFINKILHIISTTINIIFQKSITSIL